MSVSPTTKISFTSMSSFPFSYVSSTISSDHLTGFPIFKLLLSASSLLYIISMGIFPNHSSDYIFSTVTHQRPNSGAETPLKQHSTMMMVFLLCFLASWSTMPTACLCFPHFYLIMKFPLPLSTQGFLTCKAYIPHVP